MNPTPYTNEIEAMKQVVEKLTEENIRIKAQNTRLKQALRELIREIEIQGSSRNPRNGLHKEHPTHAD